MNKKYIYITVLVILLGIVGIQLFKLLPNSKQSLDMLKSQNLNSMGIGGGAGERQRNSSEMGSAHNMPISRDNCLSEECLAIEDMNYPAGELSDAAKIALAKALDDEYKAQATYETIISKLGNVRPFIMIIRAEEQHISSLKGLFDKYGLEIIENPYSGKVTSPETLSEACMAGVEAEIANAALYSDELLPNVKEYEDITLVFTNLMNASQNKHLVAFQRCAN